MFDLGGVIMDIDRDRCVRAFQNLGMTDADSFFDAYRQRGPFLLLESGKLDPDAFRREIRKLIPEEVTDGQIDAALCEFLIGIPLTPARHPAQTPRRRPQGMAALQHQPDHVAPVYPAGIHKTGP